MTLTYITKRLNSHEKCVKFLEKKRWNGIPTCPYCGCKRSSPKALRHTCLQCKNSYSVTVGTVFQNSNLPLQKWLIGISIMMSAKKGISALQLSRDLSVNKNTAWLLQMKIRAAMSKGEFQYFQNEKRSVRVTLTGHFGRARSAKKVQENDQYTPSNGCWSLLKRALIGQYHRIDEHYLYRYIDEISFKYERRNLSDSGYAELLNRILLI